MYVYQIGRKKNVKCQNIKVFKWKKKTFKLFLLMKSVCNKKSNLFLRRILNWRAKNKESLISAKFNLLFFQMTQNTTSELSHNHLKECFLTLFIYFSFLFLPICNSFCLTFEVASKNSISSITLFTFEYILRGGISSSICLVDNVKNWINYFAR